MQSRSVLLRPSRGTAGFVSLPSIVLRRRKEFCLGRDEDASCGTKRRHRYFRRVSMAVEGCDGASIHPSKHPLGQTPVPILGEDHPLLADEAEAPEAAEGIDKRVVIAGGAVLTIATGLLVALGTGVISADSFVLLAEWFEARGNTTAVLLYAVMYLVLELVAVPATPLTFGAGYLFGIPLGTAVISMSSTIAATAAFIISRYVLRDYISNIATKYPRFRAMDRAIGREGFKFVFLLRLSPLLPFSISNYLYGLTSVNLLDYVLGSWLGMLPGTIAYVSGGAAIDAVTDISGTKGTVNPVLVGIGLLATIAVLFFVGRLASNVVAAEGEFESM